jgi:AraC-like DNA-binding protein
MALYEKPLPRLYVSKERMLYLGRQHLPLRDVCAGASWLMVCLKGEVRIKAAGSAEWIQARSFLIRAGTKIIVDNRSAVIATVHLDAAKPDFDVLKSLMLSVTDTVYFNHKFEDIVIEDLLALRDIELPFALTMDRLEAVLYQFCSDAWRARAMDPRVSYVVGRLRETSRCNLSVKQFAAEVKLSESGLIKLFRSRVGVPIRSHRLWYRLMSYTMLLKEGLSSKQALRLAGFSDVAHLSRTYCKMIGIPLSLAFSATPRIKFVVPDA